MNLIKFDGIDIFPSKVVCVGRNYADHIEELNNEVPSEPVVFIKPNSAISNGIYFNEQDAVHYEGEVTFLVKHGKLFGIGFGLDLTKREVQAKLKSNGLPWERAKSFDKSAVFSEFVKLSDEIKTIRMALFINGDLVQHASYDLMLHKPNSLLSDVSRFVSLEDGDLLMTGTPKGVGVIKVGDVFVGKIFANTRLIVAGRWVVMNE